LTALKQRGLAHKRVIIQPLPLHQFGEIAVLLEQFVIAAVFLDFAVIKD